MLSLVYSISLSEIGGLIAVEITKKCIYMCMKVHFLLSVPYIQHVCIYELMLMGAIQYKSVL